MAETMPFLPHRLADADASGFNGFSGGSLDRSCGGRPEGCITEALRHPQARLFLFAEERALLRLWDGGLDPLFNRDVADALDLDPRSLVLLGSSESGPWLAGLVGNRLGHPDWVKAIDLRSLAVQGVLPAEQMGALAQARSLLAWHAEHRFCARCGGPTEMRGGGVRRECLSCHGQHFPRVDPVAIMLAVDGDRCLLGRQPQFQPGVYSALAGFVEPGETLEEAVRREVMEEAGIRIGRVAYHSSQTWPFPSSLMLGCHAEALSTEIARDETELEDCRWFRRDEVMLMLAGRHPERLGVPPPMAIAHRLIAAFAEIEPTPAAG